MPGTPIIYYGDEIGMGDNIYLGDRNGVRTPMQWNGGWNAGFSGADPERLYSPLISNPVYGYQAINVESQKRVPHSLLSWMKRLIEVRKSTQRIRPGIDRIFAAVESPGAGLRPPVGRPEDSGREQSVEFGSGCGARPAAAQREIFRLRCRARNLFPRIGELPYLLTMGPYESYWFRLRRF